MNGRSPHVRSSERCGGCRAWGSARVMAREVICPACGQPVLVGSRDDLPAANVPLAAAQTIEVVIPGTACHDGHDAPEVELASPVPSADPALGPFVYGDPAAQLEASRSASDGEQPKAELPPFDPHAEIA